MVLTRVRHNKHTRLDVRLLDLIKDRMIYVRASEQAGSQLVIHTTVSQCRKLEAPQKHRVN